MGTYRDRDYTEGGYGRRRFSRNPSGRDLGDREDRENQGWGGRSTSYDDERRNRGFVGMSDFSGASDQERYFGGGERGPDYGGGFGPERSSPDFGSRRYGSDYETGRFGSSYGGAGLRGREGSRYDYDKRYNIGSDYPSSESGYRSEGRYGDGGERGWWDKTSDEVASWFGDEEAERRREMDERHDFRGRGPKSYIRSDERITEDINDRLTDNPFLDASDIEVSVNNGEVSLTGTVDSRYAKRRAEDIAESVLGVNNVENRIRYNVDRTFGTTTTDTATEARSQAATGER